MMTGPDMIITARLRVVSAAHLRLRSAHTRIRRSLFLLATSLVIGGFAVAYWTADPVGAVPVAPAALVCCLVAIAAKAVCGVVGLQDAAAAARTLAAVHNDNLRKLSTGQDDDDDAS